MVDSLNMMQGLQIALYGFLTVFIMLSFLMIIINVMSKIVAILSKKNDKKDLNHTTSNKNSIVEDVKESVVPDAAKQEDVVYTGEIELIDVDEPTAACIMAILSEETKIPLENLIFKRIQLIKEED